jgi:putative ABC transport system permease protein
VWIWATRTDRDRAFFSIPNFLDLRAQATTLEDVAAQANWGASLTGTDPPQRLVGVRVTPNAFRLLGVDAGLGRTLMPSDARGDASPVVVLCDGLWRRAFGADPHIVGRAITLNGQAHTVVGVLPRSFGFTTTSPPAELAVPLALDADPRRAERGSNFLRVFARLRARATIDQARAELSAITLRSKRLYPVDNSKQTAPRVQLLRDEIVGHYREILLLLFAASAVVLLVACCNLAGLFVTRTHARAREIAIRSALGASRADLVRGVLAEGLVTAGAGALLGLGIAWWGIEPIVRFGPTDLPRASEMGVQPAVVGFTVAMAVLAGLAVSVIAAVTSTRAAAGDALRVSAVTGRHDGMPRRLLVGGQIALALALGVSAVLLGKSLRTILALDPGFDTDRRVVVRVSLPPARYATPDAVVGYQRAVRERLRELPQVVDVGAISVLPLSGALARCDYVVTGSEPRSPEQVPAAQNRWASADYFRAMGIRVVAGRGLDERDAAKGDAVVVVDATLARRHWPDGDAIGRRLAVEDAGADPAREVTIVGVVEPVRHEKLTEEAMPTYYAPIQQVPPGAVGNLANGMAFVVQLRGEVGDAAGALVEAIRSVDADVPASSPRPLAGSVSDGVAARRFSLYVIDVLALAALLLAAGGLYGTVLYGVLLRRREWAVRMALGAGAGHVVRHAMAGGLAVGAAGVAAGLGLVAMLGRLLRGFLYGVGPTDPASIAAATAGLLASLVLATLIPAWRATGVDPMESLRVE